MGLLCSALQSVTEPPKRTPFKISRYLLCNTSALQLCFSPYVHNPYLVLRVACCRPVQPGPRLGKKAVSRKYVPPMSPLLVSRNSTPWFCRIKSVAFTGKQLCSWVPSLWCPGVGVLGGGGPYQLRWGPTSFEGERSAIACALGGSIGAAAVSVALVLRRLCDIKELSNSHFVSSAAEVTNSGRHRGEGGGEP